VNRLSVGAVVLSFEEGQSEEPFRRPVDHRLVPSPMQYWPVLLNAGNARQVGLHQGKPALLQTRTVGADGQVQLHLVVVLAIAAKTSSCRP